MIDVCLLGSGGMMPLPDRPLSSVLFKIGSETYLFDAGEGTQVSWRVSDFTFNSCGTILISHVHYDHIGGLPGVLFQIGFSGRTEPLTIYGPNPVYEVVKALLSITGWLPFEVRVVELGGGEAVQLADGVVLSTMALSHNVQCLGYSISRPRLPRFLPAKARSLNIPVDYWKDLHAGQAVGGFDPELVTGPHRKGVRLSLITDTRYSDEIAHFVRYSDLLVCESMYAGDEDTARAWERGHMTIRQACRIAREGEVKQLWLSHFSPKVQLPSEYEPFARSLFSEATIGTSGLKASLVYPED